MTEASLDSLKSLLYSALGEPLGLVLRTSDTERARQRLYAARRSAADPALDVLQFRLWPTEDGGLVICKTGRVPNAEATP